MINGVGWRLSISVVATRFIGGSRDVAGIRVWLKNFLNLKYFTFEFKFEILNNRFPFLQNTRYYLGLCYVLHEFLNNFKHLFMRKLTNNFKRSYTLYRAT